MSVWHFLAPCDTAGRIRLFHRCHQRPKLPSFESTVGWRMIHYHGCPLSGDSFTQMALSRRHAMVSYARHETIELVAEVCQSFTLDNGAFSAWKSGATFDLDGFMSWAHKWAKHPGCDWILAPDVIDGTEAENDALLADLYEGWWVPVWHLQESLDRLENLCNDWPRVAFGSSGEYAEIGTAQWWARMAEAMAVACDPDGLPKAKFHGLRMLDPTVFSAFPFSSADSTNVARNIGMDGRWRGPYTPQSKHTRAVVMMERIELHASASRWLASNHPKNHELFG